MEAQGYSHRRGMCHGARPRLPPAGGTDHAGADRATDRLQWQRHVQ